VAYTKLYTEYKANLDDRQHDSLEELMDSRGRLESVKERHFFMEGFKLGVRLLIEALS
jgi:hypothetical protein